MNNNSILARDIDKEETTAWENIAQTKWGSYISEIEKRAILKAHSVSGPPNEAVEIGCEGGRWSKLLAEAGWKMTCVDTDSKVLRLCQSRIPTARCVLVDRSNATIPCDTGSEGLVLCLEVAPVMHGSNWFLDEAHRVLRPGGMIVGTFFNLLSYRGFIAHTTAPLRGTYDYYRSSYAAWRRTLRKHGLVFLHEEGLCWFPFRRASNSALIPSFTKAEQYLGLRKLVSLSPWVVFVAQKSS